MTTRDLYDALMSATNADEAEAAVEKFRSANSASIAEIPFGGRTNNRGAIEVASDAARSAIERVTNAHDALLDLEHQLHKGKPECRSPREAASAWLSVPDKDGLAGLSVKARQDLASRVVLRLHPGEGKQSRVITFIDRGIGISVDRMKDTILSLNESNKIEKHYLAGTYGQGGSSTFAFTRRCSVIASRNYGSDKIAFTVVRYLDLPPDKYKTGHYVYLVQDGSVLVTDAKPGDPPNGTTVRHFGYDLTNYASPIGTNSLYGALNRNLFDPVAPVRFENEVHGWNRTIKGARNALNGAEDQGDDARRPDLDHSVPMFSVALGDLGHIGVEYWVLQPPPDEGGKARKNPVDAFVDSRRPIVLTHNGQNQDEMSVIVIRKEADLPFLRNRLICHVNCDRLSPSAKRMLFSSTREKAREGFLKERIKEELVNLLKADDELTRLNEEAREHSLRDKDQAAEQQMRKQVAKLLRIVGAAVQEVGGAKGSADDGHEHKKAPPRPKPKPIILSEPPTFIRILWGEKKDIPFYAGQRRYLRLETDANSDYHDPDNPAASKINIVVGDELKVFGTSPLRGGRMRVGVECSQDVIVGGKGSIRVELYRKGLATLSDEHDYAIVLRPAPQAQDRAAPVPDFEVIPVDGPTDANWQYITEANDTDSAKYASSAEMTGGKLLIYYSTHFPRFATEMKRFEQKNPALGKSFQARYQIWLAVHSLLLQQDKEKWEGLDEETLAELERQERCRLAAMAGMVAAQEVTTGVLTEEAEAAVA